MKNLVEDIKANEGFVAKPYIDILVKKNPENYGISKEELAIIEKHLDKLKLTFGYGFTYIEEDESEVVAQMKLKKIIKEFESKEPFINELPLAKQEALIEMSYQMGVNGVLKFKKMWLALKEFDYKTASQEALDSRWATQTPERAMRIANKMARIEDV